MSAAALIAAFAKLIDHFHQTPEGVGRLTDRQISSLYAHRRDDKGEIEQAEAEPDEPLTLTGQLIQVDILAARGLITRENAAEVKEKLKVKHGGSG